MNGQNGQIGRMVDREPHVSSLAVDKFKHGEDFDQWVALFETAVGIAHQVNGADKAARKGQLCFEWLPLKIDHATLTLLNGITANTWEEAKAELSRVLTDPQEKYDWFAGRNPIVWDGKESFHSLSTRIKTKVDKYIDQGSRAREYFHRFRYALTPEYRKAIDLGCGDQWDVEEALKIATKVRIAEADAVATAKTGQPKAVAFAGAAMDEDRLKSVEMAVQGMSLEVGNLKEELGKTRQRSSEGDRRSYGSRSQSRGRDERDDRESRDRRDSRERRDYRDNRDRRDSRDRRDNRDRRDSRDRRDDRDRRGSYDNHRGDRDRRSSSPRDSFQAYGDGDRNRSRDYNRGRDGSRNYQSGRSPSYQGRGSYDRRGYNRSPSYGRPQYDDRRYNQQSPGRYSRDGYNQQGYNQWNRGYNQDRGWDNRSRPNSRERDNAVTVWDSRQSRPDDRPSFNATNFDYDALAAAMTRQMRTNQEN